MKRILCIIICLGIFTTVFSSCSHDVSSLNELNNISKINEEIKDYSFSDYDNFTFDCKPESVETDEIYIITMKNRRWKSSDENTKSELKKYVESIYNISVDPDKIEFSTFTKQDLEDEIKNGIVDSSVDLFNINAIYSDGITADLYAASNTFTACDFHDYHYSGDVHPMFRAMYSPSELPKDEFEMMDGSKLTLDEAIKEANDYIKKIEPLFNEGSSYRLRKVLIENYPNKGAVIDLRFEHMFFGLPVNDSGFDRVSDETSFVHAPYIEVKLLGKNYLGKIINSHYDIIDKKEKVDKVLPLSEAEKLASEKMAKNVKGTVKNAALKYVCVTSQNDAKHIYRPMWCFTFEEYDPDFTTMTFFSQRSVFVDAVDSKVYYSDGKSMIFAEEQ